MTTFTTTPQFGGDISAFFAKQDLTATPDPTTPPTATFGDVGDDPTSTYVPMDFLNIPGVRPEAEMDSVFAVGSYTRIQRNLANFKPSQRFTQKVRSIALLAMGVRNADGELDYYSFLAGNAQFARQIVGAKVETMDIEIPMDGTVTASFGVQSLYAGRSTQVIPAMTYGDETLPVYYGYNGTILFGADDYTDYIKKVRISIKNELERLPPKRKSLSLVGGPTICLVSRHIKAKSQVTGVSFELYEALPVGEVAKICRANPTVTISLTDDCHAGRGIGLSLPDLSFSTDTLEEGEATAIASFGAEADARTFVLTETQPT